MASRVNLTPLDHVEHRKQKLINPTGSSSIEKIVSACTGAVITMSFSKFFFVSCKLSNDSPCPVNLFWFLQ